MLRLAWPIEGGNEQWPVYRAEQAHIDFGEGPGWDLGDQEGLAWTAVADGVIALGTGYDPAFAGNIVVLDTGLLRVHYCHGQAQEVSIGQRVDKGDIIGHVGHTGWTIPVGAGGAHLHLWCEEWLGDWVRVWPSKIYNEDGMDIDRLTDVLNKLWDVKGRLESKKPLTRKQRDADAQVILDVVVAVKEEAGIQ